MWYILIFFLVVLVVYLVWLRPWHLTWGATREEVSRSLPGDHLVDRPHFNATRAITIKAPPEVVWKWIIQIGSGRAGWYSIDWIDNGGKKSSETIIPLFQHIEVDQFIPFTPDGENGMWVAEFSEFKTILWTDKRGDASWLWYIEGEKDGSSRLVTRLRTGYRFRSLWVIYYLLYDIGDIVMMKKCMKGIKKRAEKAEMAI